MLLLTHDRLHLSVCVCLLTLSAQVIYITWPRVKYELHVFEHLITISTTHIGWVHVLMMTHILVLSHGLHIFTLIITTVRAVMRCDHLTLDLIHHTDRQISQLRHPTCVSLVSGHWVDLSLESSVVCSQLSVLCSQCFELCLHLLQFLIMRARLRPTRKHAFSFRSPVLEERQIVVW